VRQLQEEKKRLGELRDDRRAVNLESISLHRDRGHFAEELTFLRRVAGEEEQTLEVVRAANQYLEKSFRDLEAHTELLDRQRKDLLQQVAKEKELVRNEERQNAEMRNRLERMRREQFTAATERREVDMREQKIREMQLDGPRPSAPADGRPRDLPRAEGHSWAKSVLVSGGVQGTGSGRHDASTGRDQRHGHIDGLEAAIGAENSRVLIPAGPCREGV